MSKLFRTGGGFLNNVSGTITGVRIFSEASKSDFVKLMVQLSIRQDGASEDVQPWPFFAGSAEGLTLNDGPRFTSDQGDDYRMGGKTDWSAFLLPILELSPELEERLTPTDYSGLIGTRHLFVQETDVEKTKQFGKQKGADGKEYDRKNLRVKSVYDLPVAAVKANGAVVKGGNKGGGKTAALKTVADVSGLAAETVQSILADNDGTLAFPKLKMKVFGAFGAKHPQRDQRDAVLAYLGDSTNLVGLDGIEFDGKTQQISLA